MSSRTLKVHGPWIHGEILIKVQATSLNPVDWKIQKYGVFIEKFPAILGTDVAGDVEELGEGVNKFKKGDRVYASLFFSVLQLF